MNLLKHACAFQIEIGIGKCWFLKQNVCYPLMAFFFVGQCRKEIGDA